MKDALRDPRRGALRGWLVLPLAALACSSAPPPPPKPAPTHVDPVQPVAAEPLGPARWIPAGGTTAIGPTLPEGTLVLVGGRRAIVDAAGKVRVEATPAPEAIVELVVVPRASGGKTRLVGRGRHGVYRFDDPLGAATPLAHAEVELTGLGSAPGLVAVWDVASEQPRFVDVETGQAKAMSGLPEPPLRAIAFESATNGAAVFQAAGLATTTDGGATWRPVGDSQGDAIRMNGVRLRGKELRAFQYGEGRDAAIDAAKATVGALEEPPAAPGDAPLLKWVRATGRDPLEVAAGWGVEITHGQAVVASHGLLARVDLGSGALSDLVEFAHGTGVSACSLARGGDGAWVACALSDEATSDDLYDPFGVMRLPLGSHALATEKPELVRNGDAELRTSPSGGVMLLGACSSEKEGVACVRQHDGSWTSINIEGDTDLYGRGAGPLADGRVALLRGRFEGDELDPGDHEGRESEPAARGLYVAVLAHDGKESRFGPPISLGQHRKDVRIQSHVEEDETRALHFVVADDEASYAVVQLPGREASVTPIPGALVARVKGSRGLALGKGEVLASLDGGSTWAEVAAPDHVKQAALRLGAQLDEPGTFVVSDVGARIDADLRIGWGHGDAPVDAAPPTGGTALPARAPQGGGKERVLVCTSAGPAPSEPPLSGQNQIKPLLETPGKAPKGTKRAARAVAALRIGMLDAVGLLEEEGSDKPGALPSKWTLRWVDPLEIGAKVHTWSGSPPKGAEWVAVPRSVDASGANALFTVKAGPKLYVARITGASAEIVEIASDLAPSSDAVFGADKGGPVAWMHDAALVAWLPGDAPRVIGSVATHAVRTLGQPTKDGVPLLVSGGDWAIQRVFAVPPASKDRKGHPDAVKLPPPSLTGWSKAPNVRREVSRLEACGKSPRGARMVVLASTFAMRLDDRFRAVGVTVAYDVRASGSDACVAGVGALVASTALPPRDPDGKKKPADATPVAFVRADLVGKRAEGGDRGLGKEKTVRRLACTFE